MKRNIDNHVLIDEIEELWENNFPGVDVNSLGIPDFDCTYLEVGLTTGCNFNCPFCYNHADSYYKAYSLKNIDTERLIGFVKKTTSLKTLALAATGEPFLSPDIFRIMNEVSSYVENFVISTNGALLNAEMLEKLSEYPIERIVFSCDGGDEEHYKLYRKNGDFNVFLENLQRAYEIFGEKISVLSVVFKENKDSLLKLPKLLKNYGLDKIGISFSPLIEKGELTSARGITPLKNNEIVCFAEKLAKEVKDNNIRMFSSAMSVPYSKNSSHPLYAYSLPCELPYMYMQIDPMEKINFCCGGVRNYYGNALDDDLSSMFNSDVLKKFRLLMVVGIFPKACTSLCNKITDRTYTDFKTALLKLKLYKDNYNKFIQLVGLQEQEGYVELINELEKSKVAIYGNGEMAQDILALFRIVNVIYGKNIKILFIVDDYLDTEDKVSVEEADFGDIDSVIIASISYKDKMTEKLRLKFSGKVIYGENILSFSSGVQTWHL